jgi:hypothetical protein
MQGVFPDYPAPVVRNAATERAGDDAVGNAASPSHYSSDIGRRDLGVHRETRPAQIAAPIFLAERRSDKHHDGKQTNKASRREAPTPPQPSS